MGAFSQKELEYLREQLVGRLATVSRKQIPQVTPVGFGVDEDRVYVNIKYDSVKARNIRGNPRVSFVVDDFPPFDGSSDTSGLHQVLISGEAELISSGKLHERGRDLIEEKFPGYEENWGVREDGWSKYILVITPIKVSSMGL
jgi:nitroimidazol reductase NimA-like FMN-containing flavoprotein (pyridoxamine 5'-phosphate oxidase superfamily)